MSLSIIVYKAYLITSNINCHAGVVCKPYIVRYNMFKIVNIFHQPDQGSFFYPLNQMRVVVF